MCLSGFDIFTLYFDTFMRTPTFITLHCCRSGRTVSWQLKSCLMFKQLLLLERNIVKSSEMWIYIWIYSKSGIYFLLSLQLVWSPGNWVIFNIRFVHFRFVYCVPTDCAELRFFWTHSNFFEFYVQTVHSEVLLLLRVKPSFVFMST